VRPCWSARPHDGHVRRRRFRSRALFSRPESAISPPTISVAAVSVSVCTSIGSETPEQGFAIRVLRPLRVRVRREVELAAAAVAHVRVQLGGGEIRVAEHLLDAAQVGAALQQMRREGVAQQMRVSGPPRAFRKSSGRGRRSR
jgi:hypothetical protein